MHEEFFNNISLKPNSFLSTWEIPYNRLRNRVLKKYFGESSLITEKKIISTSKCKVELSLRQPLHAQCNWCPLHYVRYYLLRSTSFLIRAHWANKFSALDSIPAIISNNMRFWTQPIFHSLVLYSVSAITVSRTSTRIS